VRKRTLKAHRREDGGAAAAGGPWNSRPDHAPAKFSPAARGPLNAIKSLGSTLASRHDHGIWRRVRYRTDLLLPGD
jgi:hypothetical protein